MREVYGIVSAADVPNLPYAPSVTSADLSLRATFLLCSCDYLAPLTGGYSVSLPINSSLVLTASGQATEAGV